MRTRKIRHRTPHRTSVTVALGTYVVTPDHVRSLAAVLRASELLRPAGADQDEAEITAHAVCENGKAIQFPSEEALLSHANLPPERLVAMKMERRGPFKRRATVIFDSDGTASVLVQGPKSLSEPLVASLKQQCRALDMELPWLLQAVVVQSRARKIALLACVGASLALAFCIGMWIYGRTVGVDIDPTLIPSGNAYYLRVERAIQSKELVDKMDALLVGQLQNFENVSSVFAKLRVTAIAALTVLAVGGLFLLVTRHLRKLYPRLFIALGHQQEVYKRIEKRRDIWITGIIIGFIVNIIAGIALAFVI